MEFSVIKECVFNTYRSNLLVDFSNDFIGFKKRNNNKYLFYIRNICGDIALVYRDDIKSDIVSVVRVSDYDTDRIIKLIDEKVFNKYTKIRRKAFKKLINVDKKEENFIKRVNYPKVVNLSCEELFNKLEVLDKNKRVINNYTRVIHLDRHNIDIIVDTPYEKKVFEYLDGFKCIKGIKTQSLVINYKMGYHKHKYYPDAVVLMEDNSIVFVEVKSRLGMVSVKGQKEYNALVEYCNNNGFGYIMIDDTFTSFDNIIKTKVNKENTNSLKEYLKDNKVLYYSDIKGFLDKKRFGINQLCNILYKNKKTIKYLDSNKEIRLK